MPNDTTRALAPLMEMSVLDGNGHPLERLPPTVTFGGGEAQRLLLKFEPVWRSMTVDAAFLLLTPSHAAIATSTDATIDVTRISETWTSQTLANGPPSSSAPRSRALGRSNSNLPLRVDVTAIVRAAHDDPDDHHGFLVRADASAAWGATYTTGVLDGAPPSLEVYGSLTDAERPHGNPRP